MLPQAGRIAASANWGWDVRRRRIGPPPGCSPRSMKRLTATGRSGSRRSPTSVCARMLRLPLLDQGLGLSKLRGGHGLFDVINECVQARLVLAVRRRERGGGDAGPLEGLNVILRHTLPGIIHVTETELGGDAALLGCLCPQGRCFGGITRNSF